MEVHLNSAGRKEKAWIHECVLFPSIRLKLPELQPHSRKLPLPVMPFDNVAYAYTLWYDNLSRNSCILMRNPLPVLTLKANNKESDTIERQPTVWPVPYACAQPYHSGSGSHGQLFRPC